MSSDITLVKNYWNSRPCNVMHGTSARNTCEYYDEVAQKRYKAEPHILKFINASTWSGKFVLELGCGIGTDAIQLARAGARVVCVDLTENGINMCKKNFEVHGLRGEFYVGNIETLDNILPADYKNKFDLIYSFGVIHHTVNPKQVFDNIPNFLNDNGEFRCMLYSKFSYKLFWVMHETKSWKLKGSEELIQYYSEAQTGCPITHTYTFDEIQNLISPNMAITNIWKDHVFIWDIDSYKKNLFVVDKAFENVDEPFLGALKSELGWHTLFVAKKV